MQTFIGPATGPQASNLKAVDTILQQQLDLDTHRGVCALDDCLGILRVDLAVYSCTGVKHHSECLKGRAAICHQIHQQIPGPSQSNGVERGIQADQAVNQLPPRLVCGAIEATGEQRVD